MEEEANPRRVSTKTRFQARELAKDCEPPRASPERVILTQLNRVASTRCKEGSLFVIEFDNDIPRCLSDIGRTHDLLLEEFCRCFDGSIAGILFLVRGDVEPNGDELIVVGFDGIALGKL